MFSMLLVCFSSRKVEQKSRLQCIPEAATETIFENICSFLPGALFSKFFMRLYVFTEQITIFQEGMSVRWTDTNFPGAHLCVHRTDTDFPGAPILAIEQVPIFLEHAFLATEQIPTFQEHLFSYRTDTDFPEALIFWLPNRYRFSRNTLLATEQITIFQEAFFEYQRTDRQFPGRYPSPNRHFSIRSRWLLSYIEILYQKIFTF